MTKLGFKRGQGPKTKKVKRKKSHTVIMRDKCDDLFSLIVRLEVGYCEMCRKQGEPLKSHPDYEVNGLQLHHVIERTNFAYRYDRKCALILCEGCHKFNRNNSPHWSSASGERFRAWLKENKPEQYDWMIEHEKDGKLANLDYDAIHADLNDQLTALTLKGK
jgi:hypothetical protein